MLVVDAVEEAAASAVAVLPSSATTPAAEVAVVAADITLNPNPTTLNPKTLNIPKPWPPLSVSEERRKAMLQH